jgi:hypothetical protein
MPAKTNRPVVLFALSAFFGSALGLLSVAPMGGSALAADSGKHASAKKSARPGRGSRTKKGKREKQQVDFEKVSFPHEEAVAPPVVVVPKIPAARPGLKPASDKPTHARAVDPQPGVVFEPAPAPPAAPAPVAAAAPAPRPPGPPTTLKSQSVAPETGTRIDAMVAKAFVPAAASKPEGREEVAAPASAPGAPDTDEIANNMKPVRAQIKTECPFGERGVLMVRVEVGAGGRVANVTPEGPLAERASATCVIDAVYRARFPASAGASFRYPFPVK